MNGTIVYNENYFSHNIEVVEIGKKRYEVYIDGERYHRQLQSIKLALYTIHRVIDATIRNEQKEA